MKKMLLSALAVLAFSTTAQADNNGAAKMNTVKQMYQRYFANNDGGSMPILYRFGDANLQKAVRLESAYARKHQGEACIDYDVMSNSQDPDAVWGIPPNYVKRKPIQLSLLSNGRVKEKYSGVSYALSCTGNQCKVSDVFNEGYSVKKMLMENCR